MLHYGRDTDKNAIREKFSNLFRAELDKDGRPVPYQKFRGYMLKLLDGIDRSKAAQELILEQFVEEAKSGRLAFHCQSFQSISDEPFASHGMSSQVRRQHSVQEPSPGRCFDILVLD